MSLWIKRNHFSTTVKNSKRIRILLILLVIVFQQMLGPNINAAFMHPLGHVAGVGAAIIAMVPMVVGALLGNVINDAYDGTITPISIGFVVSSMLTVPMKHRLGGNVTVRPPPRSTFCTPLMEVSTGLTCLIR